MQVKSHIVCDSWKDPAFSDCIGDVLCVSVARDDVIAKVETVRAVILPIVICRGVLLCVMLLVIIVVDNTPAVGKGLSYMPLISPTRFPHRKCYVWLISILCVH